MTYMFEASILKYYFDLNQIEYDIKSVESFGNGYRICDFYKPDLKKYQPKIHIYGKSDLNESFPQKITALSVTWFKNSSNAEKIKKLKKNIYNYFTNKEPAKAERIMWTCFKDSKKKLDGKGYARSFVSCNCRATNDYCKTDHLAYCVNIYPHVGVTQFFLQHGINMDADKYALSEMLQWIWRSCIRTGGEIWIYIPSKRMRKLLIEWMK